jgi:hypothetical protein
MRKLNYFTTSQKLSGRYKENYKLSVIFILCSKTWQISAEYVQEQVNNSNC